MKRFLAAAPIVTATSALILGQGAWASGWIVVDPVAGMPLTHVAPTNPTNPTNPANPTSSASSASPANSVTALSPARLTPVPATRLRHRQPFSVIHPGPGDGHVTDTTPSPAHSMLKGQISFGLHLQSEEIKVEVGDQVAKTYITQIFSNDTDRNLAGTYLFPLPEDTTFSSFSLMIDGKPVEGKILEAAAARQEYEQIVRRMVDPGLLEYADYKTVRARIFPIPAHGTKKVELEYTQVLKADNGMLKYRFPLKSEEDATPAEQVKVSMKLASTAGLRTIWSPSHKIESEKRSDHQATIKYEEHNVVPDKDFLLYFNTSDKDLAANVLTHKVNNEDGYFLLTISPPMQSKAIGAKDIVLVADTSGSMQGEKMEQAQKALKYIINGLNTDDRFGIVQFSTDVTAFKPQLFTASATAKKAADSFVDEMEARGGTNIGEALSTATTLLDNGSGRPGYLVLITDGEPTVGETEIAKLIERMKSKRDLRVFDFGVGFDVNTKLLNGLAQNHHGLAQYVEPQENIETSVSSLYTKIKSPVLTDVQIAYDGVEVKDVFPREVKDIFAGSQVLLIGKYKGSGKVTVKISGKLNGADRSFSFPLQFAGEETGHSYLPRLWAMRRIAHLTEVAQANGNNKEVVDEIISLSKRYGIISQYTSLLVTDPNEASRNRPVVMRMHAARALAADAFTGGAPLRFAGAASGAGGGPAPAPAPTRSPRRSTASASVAPDYGSYMSDLSRRTKRAWFPPKGNESHQVVVGFSVKKDGSVSNLHLQKSSGVTMADQAALKAVEAAAPYSPLPARAGDKVDLAFTFGMNLSGSEPALGIDPSDRVRSALSRAGDSGEKAVSLARSVNQLASETVALGKSEDSDGRVKTMGEKTFFLHDGYWTDSAFDESSGVKPHEITFGSDKYFDLLKKGAELAQYLSVGKQVIFEFKGQWYKVVLPTAT